MEITMAIEGSRAAEQTTDLRAFLFEARLPGIQTIDQQMEPPKAGEQGPAALAALTVILGAPAVVELVRGIFRYIEARRPKIKITVKTGEHSVEIDCVNPPSLEKVVDSIEKILPR
ncbi:effector-associated constant component EACC1 [Burkholderia gladioli]|uniref:effector-associated constant component EACC1 n=1 Tax=Burkholderia gladioli TaxID=28095 RepID=UPI0022D7083D|nr:hypothetical protein [Burkholderia gladioli]MDA0575999.1 hypothetical protein [Burkholderia gladioli]MDA0604168.1 hypothetical protein [Burkholderia gladioli]